MINYNVNEDDEDNDEDDRDGLCIIPIALGRWAKNTANGNVAHRLVKESLNFIICKIQQFAKKKSNFKICQIC